jgi:hypothetical protein
MRNQPIGRNPDQQLSSLFEHSSLNHQNYGPCDMVDNLADSENTCQICYLYVGNPIPEVMTRNKEY